MVMSLSDQLAVCGRSCVQKNKQKKKRQKGEGADSRILRFCLEFIVMWRHKNSGTRCTVYKETADKGAGLIYTLVFKRLGGSLDFSVKFL